MLCQKSVFFRITNIFILIFSGFISLYGYNAGENVRLSDNAELTMLTSTPGENLYSVFGHSALRVNDPENNIDLIYNYGTFDFDTPNFYLKFASGRLKYMLSVSNYKYYEYSYRREGRAIYEQVLDLTRQEKQRIFEFVQKNALPENRYYYYDFFYDNCATRIRDVLDDLVAVEWYEDPYDIDRRTFRELLSPYLENMPWSKFGIDIALGLPADKVATRYEYMFIPDEMFIAFAMARMADTRPLVGEHRVLLEKGWPLPPPHPLNPNIVFWIIFVIGLLTILNKYSARIFDMIFFSALCINGLLILFLWFVSEHEATNSNMNLLWALPTHICFFYKHHFRKISRFARLYFKSVMVLSALMILFWNQIPQEFNTAFFPIILLILLKSIPPALNIDISERIRSLFARKQGEK